MRTAFEVGVVLLARDMYSKVVAKAERDLGALRNVSQKSADEFTKSFNQAKKIGAIGLGITAAGVAITNYMKGAVEQAGETESAISRVLIDMGESANVSKEMIKKAFSEIKTTWGMTDGEISDSMRAAGGRFGDYAKGIEATSIAAVLATARSIDLGSATNMLTTTFMQFSDRMDKGLSDEEKMIGTGNVLSEVMKRLGGNWEGLNLYLGSTSIKAKSAGQSMETVLATAAILGKDAVKLKMGGAAMDNILDTMTKLRSKSPGLLSLMPNFRKNNDFIVFLEDMKGAMAKLGIKDTQQQLAFLSRYFGSSADMVQYFISNLEDLKTQKKTLTDLSAQTDKGSQIFKDANEQTKNWEKSQVILNARLGELKEALATSLLPLTEAFSKALGGLAKWLSENKLAAGILGVAGAIIGIGGAIATIAGPMVTLLGAFKMWRLQADLTRIAQAGLNREAILGGAPIGNINSQMKNLTGSTSGLVGMLSKVGVVATAAFAGWEIGTLLRQIPGLDEAVQKLIAHLQGKEFISEEQENSVYSRLGNIRAELKKGVQLPEETIKKYIEIESRIAKSYGPLNEDFIAKLVRSGISEEQARKYSGIKIPSPGVISGASSRNATPAIISGASGGSATPIPQHQAGTARVNKTGLAIVHEGEEIRNKSMASRSNAESNINLGGITINLISSGSTMTDAENIARLVMAKLDRRLKAEARRF